MSIISNLMLNNMVSTTGNDPSRYVKESLAIRDMEAATMAFYL